MAETAARRGISADQVYAAAESISSGGNSPTIRSVRDLLGTGSLTTIRRYLAAWRDQRPSEAAPAHEMPSDLVAAYSRELQRVADTATSAMRKDLAEARQEADDLTDAGELLESERDEALARAEAAERSRDKLSGQVEQQVQEIERLRADLAETRKVADNLRTDLAEARNRNTTLTEQRDTAKTELTEVKAELANAREEAAEQRDTMSAQLTDLRAEIADLFNKNSALTEQRDTARTDLAEVKKELTGVRREATETRDGLVAKLNELQDKLAAAEKNEAVAQVERSSAKQAFDDIKLQLAEHKKEQKQEAVDRKEETKVLQLKIDELQSLLNKKEEKQQESKKQEEDHND